MVFAIDDSPFSMIGAFDATVAFIGNQDEVEPAFKNGGGVSWGDQSTCLFCATARFFRPGYKANLIDHWLPSLDESRNCSAVPRLPMWAAATACPP